MFRSALLSLAVLLPAAVSAQSVSFDGTLALGTTDIAGGSGIGVIDATASIPLIQRYPLTFEIGAYLFGLDGKRPHETYVAFAWDDTWRVGVVRPAFDQVLPSVFARAAPYLAYERAEYTRAHATVEAMRRTAVPWGVSWQQAFGQTDVAVSIHDANKGNFRSASVALTYRGAGWTLAAAVETVAEDDFTHEGINAKLGARFDVGQMDVGVTYLRPDVNDTPDALALDVVVPVSSRVDLLAFGELTDKSRDDAYGLALDYKVQRDSSVLFSATDGARDSAVHMTLERRF
ncbi:hypothetical protein [Antarctobacter heliothermus]|uniref:Porin domain-containing protein n=1 Tax=Antarctobacter heliothermus TaxID=74033 RepID=A0A239G200_9RHOB|nr:hypothetical protein [Antarctobacter heliothermus]SNS62728.1 hypothetical protein SAMN04488078_102350 [Antarctobacter heliothermus]